MSGLTPLEAAEILENMIATDKSVTEEMTGKQYRSTVQAASHLRQIAAGELRTVVHGKWTTQGGDEYHCSVCDYETNGLSRSKFCPFCGARMDGKEDSHA